MSISSFGYFGLVCLFSVMSDAFLLACYNSAYPQCAASSFNTYIYIGCNYPLTVNSISISICYFFVLEPFSAFILILYKVLNMFSCLLTTFIFCTISVLFIYLMVDFFFLNLRHTLKNETQGMEGYMFGLL